MGGLRLREMESEEMVDVLHFLFEDDINVYSAEQQESKNQARAVVYDSLYGKTYKYGIGKSSGGRSGGQTYADGSTIPSEGFFGETEITEFDPTVPQVRKPYVPPTDFNPDSPLPFGKDLDAPLG